ncbi:MAG: serine/threonine protein kinase [Candidatus Aenigmarchaeota archaeon]|nr:serine/threonine protein kinase [Candidatus Aenigmarchaeota archaeon]
MEDPHVGEDPYVGKRIRDIRIVALAGKGAMGAVYKAVKELTDETLALKILELGDVKEAEREGYVGRFKNEIRALGRVRSPYTPYLRDSGEDVVDGRKILYYCMLPLVENALSKEELMGLDASDIVEILRQAAEGIEAYHSEGITHRDIKPANFLVARTDSRFHVIVADPGVARLKGMEMTQTGQFIGTPKYMPPEVLQGRGGDHRGDIFSHGLIGYTLLTRVHPFDSDDMAGVFYKILHVEPLPPRELNPEIPPELDGIIMREMEKNPDRRYRSMREVAEALKKVGSDMRLSRTVDMEKPRRVMPPLRQREEIAPEDEARDFIYYSKSFGGGLKENLKWLFNKGAGHWKYIAAGVAAAGVAAFVGLGGLGYLRPYYTQWRSTPKKIDMKTEEELREAGIPQPPGWGINNGEYCGTIPLPPIRETWQNASVYFDREVTIDAGNYRVAAKPSDGSGTASLFAGDEKIGGIPYTPGMRNHVELAYKDGRLSINFEGQTKVLGRAPPRSFATTGACIDYITLFE